MKLTGIAPLLVAATILCPQTGTLSASGAVPTTDQSVIITPGPGTISINGYSPSLSISFNTPVEITLPSGVLSAEGISPVCGHGIVTSTGGVSASGSAPSIVRENLIHVPSGSISLAGSNPKNNRGIIPPAGSVLLTGVAPSVIVQDSRTMTPLTGALGISGVVPHIQAMVMVNTLHHFTALTGGTAIAMDSIDGGSLVNGDRAFCIVAGAFIPYWLNATSGAADNGATIIAPDSNAGLKRWIKCT